MGNNTEDGFVEIERTKDGAKKTMRIDEMVDIIENMKNTKKDINLE